MKNYINDIVLSSPKQLLERFQQSKSDYGTEFHITIADRYNNRYSGFFVKFDSELKIVLLTDKEHEISFIDTDSIVNIAIYDFAKHERFLLGQELIKQVSAFKADTVEDCLALLKSTLQKTHSLDFNFTVDEVKPANLDKIKAILEALGDTLMEVASDDFSKEYLSQITDFYIKNEARDGIRFRKTNTTILVRFNFEEELPADLQTKIENGINDAF
jgi:hypothetical protein